MALIVCPECGREVSDKAAACIGCGAPIVAGERAEPASAQAAVVSFDSEAKHFIGPKQMIVDLAIKSIMEVGYKVDSADAASGIVAFTTGVTWGSWSGVSGSVYIREVSPGRFEATGNAKQNVKGGQIAAFNIGNEAQKKVRKVLEAMRAAVEG